MVYASLITWAILGVLGLMMQATLLFKNELATFQPDLQPALKQLCALADCQLTPLQQPDAVVIDHAAIDHQGHGMDGAPSPFWSFEIHLRNSATFAVATPWLELTLTDAQDQVVMRKAIDVRPLGAPAVLAPGEIVSLTHQLTLINPDLNFMGYRLLTFYP